MSVRFFLNGEELPAAKVSGPGEYFVTLSERYTLQTVPVPGQIECPGHRVLGFRTLFDRLYITVDEAKKL